jgi:hypothetical protein
MVVDSRFRACEEIEVDEGDALPWYGFPLARE